MSEIRVRARPRPTRTIDDVVQEIRIANMMRRATMRSVLAQVNQCRAMAMNIVGYSSYGEETDRKELLACAKVLMAHFIEDEQLPRELVVAANQIRPYMLHAQAVMALNDAKRSELESVMRRLARELPVFTYFVEGTIGIADLGLATIVGECDNLGRYDSHYGLWKRLGLAVVEGTAQGRGKSTKGGQDMTLAEREARRQSWITRGYSGERRSVTWNIGNSFIKIRKSPYRDIYDARKAYEIAQFAAQGLTVKPAAEIRKSDAGKVVAAMHVHLRAQRYAEKKLVKHLYYAWRAGDKAYPYTGVSA